MSYTPKTWTTGETITAAELNAIEQATGAAAATADIGTAGTATGDAVKAAIDAEGTAKGWGAVADATTTVKGVLKLTGDLAGTATAPTVVGGTHHGHTASQISDASTVGRAVMTAADAPTARSATGAAAFAHTHPVTDLTATGTLDGTHFLAGDNTWKVPAGVTQTIANAAAGAVFTVRQNSDGTWPARTSTRQDIYFDWRFSVAGSAAPTAATTPGTTTDGTYPGDAIFGA